LERPKWEPLTTFDVSKVVISTNKLLNTPAATSKSHYHSTAK